MANDQRVLVTGAGSGIGYETALTFARQGYAVMAAVRSLESGGALADTAAREGLSVRLAAGDLTTSDGVGAIVASAGDFGAIDILVNNAGAAARGAVEATDDATTNRLFALNVLAPLRLIRAFAGAMRERKSGAIVNVSSMAGVAAQPFDGLYSASKHALEGMTEQLYYELKPFGVRVVSIQPGRIETPIRDKLMRHAGDGVAYADGEAAWFEATEKTLFAGAGSPASLVAATILESVQTASPKLRWPVGPDAHMIAQTRRQGEFEAFETMMRAALGWNG